MGRQRWWRGLLARVTLIYAFGALALSATVAFATFTLAQNRLLAEVEGQHRRQVYRNAIDVNNRLIGFAPLIEEGLDAAANSDDEPAESTAASDESEEITDTEAAQQDDEPGTDDVSADDGEATEDESADDEAASEEEAAVEAAEDVYKIILGELRYANGAKGIIILPDGAPKSLTLTRRNIPTKLQAAVNPPDGLSVGDEEMNPAQMRFRDGDVTNYAVGVRLEDVDVSYYEILPLTELENTLGSLRVILLGVSFVASVAGAGLGYYSARGALSPLPRISGAARSIAAGDFSTKLKLEADRDLAVLTVAFNEMVDAVSDRIEREQRFTSDVSHELRSPLMTLTASVEVLERRKESLPDVAQQAIDLLSHDLRRFQRLVEDLLEVSRMEAGAVQLQLSRFKLSEFLENVIYQSRSPHLELIYSPDDAMTSITADKRRLAQVMTNLLENAEKYGEGADAVRFEVVGENVQIVVADSGPGVPANQRERIFERFGRAEAGNRTAAPGFGLGLSLVAEHVRLHGGQVWVTDRIDGAKGARFVVQLPVGEHIDIVEEMAE